MLWLMISRILPRAIERAADALGFAEVKMSFFQADGLLGVSSDASTRQVREVISWTDSQYPGYFPRDRAFSAEFPLNGLRFVYGSVNYQFPSMVGKVSKYMMKFYSSASTTQFHHLPGVFVGPK